MKKILTVDSFIQALSDEICESSGLDAAGIFTNLPDVNGFAEITQKVFNINTAVFRDEMYRNVTNFGTAVTRQCPLFII